MKRLCATMLLALSLGLGSELVAATGAASAASGAVLGDATKAKKVPDPPPLVVVGVQEDGLRGSCTLVAKRDGDPRKGVRGSFEATLIDINSGTTLSDLGRKKGRTNKEGVLTVSYPIPRMADFAVQAAMVVELNLAGGKKITLFDYSCELVDDTA